MVTLWAASPASDAVGRGGCNFVRAFAAFGGNIQKERERKQFTAFVSRCAAVCFAAEMQRGDQTAEVRGKTLERGRALLPEAFSATPAAVWPPQARNLRFSCRTDKCA
jgi:hypothetical protein